MLWFGAVSYNIDVRVSMLPKAIQPGQRANDQARAGNRRGSQAHLVEGVYAQQLVFGAGLEDEGVAVFAQREDFAIGRPG